jgi:predicted dehydrogenase
MQAIHQLDSFLWIAGMPSRVTARAWSGRPDVQVEDDVYAVLEFPGGARGMLSASTLDPAGINRLEIACDAGALRAEGERARLGRWGASTSGLLAESKDLFGGLEVTWEDVEPSGDAMTYDECVYACERDFLDAITSGRVPAIGPDEGTKSVEVANAVYLSAVTGDPVDLPLDPSAYDDAFARMCAGELALATIE